MVHLHHPSTTFVASVNDAQTLRSHKDPTQLACALPVADNLIWCPIFSRYNLITPERSRYLDIGRRSMANTRGGQFSCWSTTACEGVGRIDVYDDLRNRSLTAGAYHCASLHWSIDRLGLLNVGRWTWWRCPMRWKRVCNSMIWKWPCIRTSRTPFKAKGSNLGKRGLVGESTDEERVPARWSVDDPLARENINLKRRK